MKLGRKDDVHRRRIGILAMLADFWKTPYDIGGHYSSHHSRDLLYLTNMGLAEKRRGYAGVSSGSYMYRITKAGQKYLQEQP